MSRVGPVEHVVLRRHVWRRARRYLRDAGAPMTRQEAAAVHAALTALTERAERAEAALRARRPTAPVIDLAEARRRAEARYVERMRDAT